MESLPATVNPQVFELLTIDVNIEYELDMNLFPGFEDPITRAQPTLLMHQPPYCPCANFGYETITEDDVDDLIGMFKIRTVNHSLSTFQQIYSNLILFISITIPSTCIYSRIQKSSSP